MTETHTDADAETAEETDGSADPETTRKDAVEAELRKVRDPDADVDVFEAGLIEEIRVAGGDVTVAADLEDFGPGDGERVAGAMMRAATSVEGVERAHVEHVSRSTGAERSAGVAGIDRVIAVASAKGGVGKSTVATHLACALAVEGSVGLFDADVHGPNVPDLLGISGPIHSDEEGRPLPVETDGMEVMSVGLMQDGAPLAWRGAMAHDALTELFEETAWADRETLVVDLPPGTGDVVLTTLQEVPVDGVVVVTTPFHAAVTDTGRSVELFRENDVPVLGVVSNMGSFACPTCGDDHDLFPDGSPLDSDALDAPVLAELPFDHAMQGTPAPGEGPETMADLADAVRERVAEIWDVTVPDHGVDLRDVAPEHRRDRVREAFEGLGPGDPFVVVSDRNPSPVRPFLAELADTDPGGLDPFRVRQQNPETWLLETRRP